MKSQDRLHLEARIKELHQSIKGLGDGGELEELAVLIHRPGWTTQAEAQLVTGLVESLHKQVANILDHKQLLVAASRAVLDKKA